MSTPAPTHEPSLPLHTQETGRSLLFVPPRDRQCPSTGATPTGHSHGAVVLWHGAASCIPTLTYPWVCPSKRYFTVSQRGLGNSPLSQVGPREHPKTTLPIPAAALGRQQRVQALISGPCGTGSRECQAAQHTRPGQGIWDITAGLAQTGSKELLILPSSLWQEAAPKKPGKQAGRRAG